MRIIKPEKVPWGWKFEYPHKINLGRNRNEQQHMQEFYRTSPNIMEMYQF